MTVAPSMQRNIDAFCSQLDRLLIDSRGKFVVFVDGTLVNVSDSLDSALSSGYRESGSYDFMVQRVEPLPERIDFHVATCLP